MPPRELNLNVNQIEAEVSSRTTSVSSEKSDKTAEKPSGTWTGLITRESLGRTADVAMIFQDALRVGLLTDGAANRVRVRAMALQARSLEIERPGGYVIRKIESKAWHTLHPDKVTEAAALLGYPPLTAEQIAKIRTAGD